MKDDINKWLAQQLGAQFQLDPLTALAVVAITSALFGFLGKMAWTGVVKLWESRRYGRWKIEVSGGKSGRNWHAPLETDLIKLFKKKKYFAFKRDLGTILSGEGQLDFSFGVSPTEPAKATPPTAPGLTIDEAARTITIDYAKAKGR